MNEANLTRLMKLVRRTGDTLVVTDPDGDDPIVLMPIERYEVMCDPSCAFEDEGYAIEDEFEPADIADQIADFDPYSPIVSEPETVAVPDEEEDDQDDQELSDEEMLKIDREVASELSRHPAGEVEPEKAPSSAVNGEERFYLEPIE